MRLIHSTTAMILLSISTTASAGLLYMDGAGGDYGVASNHDYLYYPADNPSYNIGGNLHASTELALTYFLLGSEAGYSNDLLVDGATVLNNKTHGYGDSHSTTTGPGLVDFGFWTRGTDPDSGINNGANTPFGSYQSFATLLGYEYDGILYDALVMFDDSGAGPDEDFDDLMIGIRAVQVPEPGTLALLGLGLMSLATRRWLQRSV